MKTRLIITGGATGLGKALALSYANNLGANLQICIADINTERAAVTIAELQALKADAFFHACDITKQTDIEGLCDIIQTKWQGVDIVVNNAGVATGGSLEGESLEQWQWIMEINLLSMVRVCKTFYPVFKQQGKGYFINIASQAGLTPIPFMSSYNAVKAAVVSFSETLKLELAYDNIDVSVVCPSFFKTNLDESMRTSEPAMQTMLNRAFERSPITAEQVADIIYKQSLKRSFLILTHKLGKQAFLMKKLLPVEWYIKSMLKKTRSMQRLKSK
ncbi:MAG TPA: SDR family oxidoreductase [Pseudoalteromonas sp.]|uniref:Short chain dehydrogenase n=1 Tax=marine sediment metagenome TaxID=412755 RepID=A0A0F9Q635_9ZZZZ|nr:SDR family oxidoreductase [Pseudoalteromonas sp.]HDY93080.1 SDR family oxidoreductase [Pseudoalteromonas sp.]HDZ32530.1 SDR family oxidoreductase [Pseudoalteromonas sp.]